MLDIQAHSLYRLFPNFGKSDAHRQVLAFTHRHAITTQPNCAEGPSYQLPLANLLERIWLTQLTTLAIQTGRDAIIVIPTHLDNAKTRFPMLLNYLEGGDAPAVLARAEACQLRALLESLTHALPSFVHYLKRPDTDTLGPDIHQRCSAQYCSDAGTRTLIGYPLCGLSLEEHAPLANRTGENVDVDYLRLITRKPDYPDLNAQPEDRH